MDINSILTKVINQSGSAFFYTPSYYDESKSYLCLNPDSIITANKKNYFNALKEIDNSVKNNLPCFGLINYEAGYLNENKLKELLKDGEKDILKFFFFKKENVKEFNSSEIEFNESNNENFSITNFHLNTTKKEFKEAVKKI